MRFQLFIRVSSVERIYDLPQTESIEIIHMIIKTIRIRAAEIVYSNELFIFH